LARLVTLQTLENRVKQRANVEVASNSALYSATELLDNINEGLAALYSMIIGIQDQPYYLESATFSTSSGQDTYVIGPGGGPNGSGVNVTDFFKLAGIDVTVGQNIVITAKPFTWSERNRYKYLSGWIYSQPVFYRLVGKSNLPGQAANDSIKFIPAPSGGFSCTLWYYPTPPVLAQATDTFDGINGYEEFAVLQAARKLLVKQEQLEHAAALTQMLAEERERISGELGSHDAENPPRVQDTMLNDGWIGRPGY
jgi:hypothetical protein